MGFFAEFNTWLNGMLAQYIASNTAAIARILEPSHRHPGRLLSRHLGIPTARRQD